MEDQARRDGFEHHSGKDSFFLNTIYFLGPWMDDRQQVDIGSEGRTVFRVLGTGGVEVKDPA